jgi:Phytanoyl-CoA dioxygenase (PhyH)
MVSGGEQIKNSYREMSKKVDDFQFRIPLVEEDYCIDTNAVVVDDDGNVSESHSQQSTTTRIPQSLIEKFQKDGFVVFESVISKRSVNKLNDRLEDVLRGTYDRGNKPDKVPKLLKSRKPPTETVQENVTDSSIETNEVENDESDTNKTTRKRQCKSGPGPIGFSGNLQNVKVLQIINIHKADSLFRSLETSEILGDVVSQLGGWGGNGKESGGGARLAQDQVWAKPPQAPPLVFHRDSPYFMFDPPDVVTVWIALDDMDEELGPLQYVRGSHLWGDGRLGSASQFFQSNVKRLLQSAAEREGLHVDDLDIISMAGLQAGSLSIHHGKIWHGSGKNESTSRPRRGLGLHFVPANVRFTTEARHSSLWKSYVTGAEDPLDMELPEEDFPIVGSSK